MNKKAVIKNILTKGPIATYRLKKQRDYIRDREKKIIDALDALISNYCLTSEGFDALFKIISDYEEISGTKELRVAKNDLTKRFHEKLYSLESSDFLKEIRSECIKKRIPLIYSRESKSSSIEKKKAVFLQPRKGLNQAFKTMFNYLVDNGYDCILFELGRGMVPSSVYFYNALCFAKEAAKAKVVFFHESNDLLGHTMIRDDQKVVQLWHGCGIFKKIGLSTAGQKGYKSLEKYQEYPEYNYYSCVTIASEELAWVFEEFMGIAPDSNVIKPIGVSRTDVFFDQDYIDACYKKLYERIPEARNKKVILYAPTYRGLDPNRTAPNELDLTEMANRLMEDHVLIIKHHQTVVDLPSIPENLKNSFVFDMTRGSGMDISELMTVSDVCVSDYSSLIFEFALFERPVAFFAYDLDDYIDNRGLYYDYDEITPGPVCKTTEELCDYLESLREGFDSSEITAFKNRFMNACDGHSTERIVRYIEED